MPMAPTRKAVKAKEKELQGSRVVRPAAKALEVRVSAMSSETRAHADMETVAGSRTKSPSL